MASLDKAFIKAYRQRESDVGTIPLDTSGTESLVDALEDRPLREAKVRTAAARHDSVLAALQSVRQSVRLQVEPEQAAPTPPSEAASRSIEQDALLETGNQAVPPFLHPQSVVRRHAAAGGSPSNIGEDAAEDRTARVDAVTQAELGRIVPPPHLAASTLGNVALPSQPATAPGTTDAEVDKDNQPSRGSAAEESVGPPLQATKAESSRAAAQAKIEAAGENGVGRASFQPRLQVDRIVASSVGRRLRQRAADELDRLGGALAALAQEGRKVVGFASAKPCQGTTTLLGAVALGLAERGVPVAVVDADISDPQLASELGLAPEYGWEQGLAESIPCEELVIGSVEQPIALMPLCRRFDTEDLPDDFTRFREGLAALREHYELVLVDLGAWGDALAGRMLKTLDTVVLVRDVRSTRPEQIQDLYRTLVRADVNVAGIVESFVRGG